MIAAPPRAPRLWQTLGYGLRPDPFFSAARARAGDVFEVKVLAETWTILGHPDGVREVFAHGPEDLDSGVANRPLRPVLGTRNVLLLDGPEHLRRRKLVLPPLHGERMRAYEDLIREAAAAEVASWPRGVPFPVLPRMQALTFTVIQGAVFGPDERERLAPLAEALSDLITWITAVPRAAVYAFFGPEAEMRLPGYRRRIAALDRLVAEQVARRRADPALAERPDVLSLLLQARDEDGHALSDEEVRDELVTLLVAGHETTAATLAWALHDLARAPTAQERIGEDAFAEAVVTETLRLHPPVPLVVRRLRRPLRFAGRDLPTGATVAPCSLLVHRRPDVYPEPLAFRPDRWLGAQRRRPAAAEWFPFGGSVRRCVGAAFATFEARVVVEEVTRAVRLTPEQPARERTGRRGIVLVPGRGGRVVAEG